MNTILKKLKSISSFMMNIVIYPAAFRDFLAQIGWYLPTVKFVLNLHMWRNSPSLARSALSDALDRGMITKKQYKSLHQKYFNEVPA